MMDLGGAVRLSGCTGQAVRDSCATWIGSCQIAISDKYDDICPEPRIKSMPGITKVPRSSQAQKLHAIKQTQPPEKKQMPDTAQMLLWLQAHITPQPSTFLNSSYGAATAFVAKALVGLVITKTSNFLEIAAVLASRARDQRK